LHRRFSGGIGLTFPTFFLVITCLLSRTVFATALVNICRIRRMALFITDLTYSTTLQKSLYTMKSRILFLLFCCFGAITLMAQTPSLTVQGILKKADGSAVPDDTYTVRFALFDAEMGGNEVWFEQLTDVETIGGVYSVVLGTHGKTLNAPFNQDYYLSVKIGNSSQELLPRPRLTPAPYALSLVGASAAGIWVGGLNVIHATTGEVTINSLLKLPYGFARTYTAGQPGLSESTEGSAFSQLYLGSPEVRTRTKIKLTEC